MVNTEGSRDLSKELFIRKHIVRVLSDRQMAILTGSLLGDGYIHPLGKICFEQCSLQKSYLLWKYEEFKDFAYPKIAKVSRIDKRNDHTNNSYRFFLKQYFRSWRQVWYPKDIKTIPDNIGQWFTPLSLAVWYMDDGHLFKGKQPLIASECFTREDLLKMINILHSWGIEVKLRTNNRMWILQSSVNNFMKLISPYIVNSMKYKILDPVTT